MWGNLIIVYPSPAILVKINNLGCALAVLGHPLVPCFEVPASISILVCKLHEGSAQPDPAIAELNASWLSSLIQQIFIELQL